MSRWTEAEYKEHLVKRMRQSPVKAQKKFDPFPRLCVASGLPEPETEVTGLVVGRKFRVDYLFREARLVVEKNGQIWKKGGHSSGTGLLRDYEKNNLLQLAGYRVLTYTPQQIAKGECLGTLKVLLTQEQESR